MRHRLLVLGTLSALALSPLTPMAVHAAPAPPSYQSAIEYGRGMMGEMLDQGVATSMSIALADHGRIVWQEATGPVDASDTRATTTTTYGIGSVSKMITTVAVMQLVDAGKVSLDKPLVNYVPDFRMADPAYRQITVRMLLNHSAGLPGTDYANSSTTAPFPGYAAQVMTTLRSARLKTTPGSMSVYCNDCFTLASVIVERVSGMSFTDFVQRNVLDPLEMTHSGYLTSTTSELPYAPVLTENGPLEREYNNAYASGGMSSTPADMSHLATMLMNGGVYAGRRVLSERAVAKMATDQVASQLDPVVQASWRYGLGWDTVLEPALASAGIRGWQKGGDINQYHAAFLLAPKQHMSVTITAASDSMSSEQAETIARSVMLYALNENGTIDSIPVSNPQDPPAVRPTTQQLRAISGAYLGSGVQSRVVTNENRSLTVLLNSSGEWSPLQGSFGLRSDGRWWNDTAAGVSISMAKGWDRTYLVLTVPGSVGDYLTNTVLGERVTPTAALSPAWQARVDKVWVPVNEMATSFAWDAPIATSLTTIDGAPGYLLATGVAGKVAVDPAGSESVASMFLVIPGMQGRDLNDVTVAPHGSEEWLTIGSTVLRPVSSIAALAAGSTVFGPEGFAEWRIVPADGRLTTSGASAWKLFGRDLEPISAGSGDAIDLAVSARTYLVLFAPAGTSVTTTVSGAAT